MTEFEAERERLATISSMISDQLIFLDGLKDKGKDSFTIEEIKDLLIQYAKTIKIHK